MVKNFLRASEANTRETVGDNLHVEMPLTNCKVLHSGKKRQMRCEFSEFSWVWLGRLAHRRWGPCLLLSYPKALAMHTVGI